MLTRILFLVVFSMPVIAQDSNFDPLVFLRVFAPIMGGFVDYNKFDLRADTDTDRIPMNETGSAGSGNLYLPFFDFTADPFAPATTKAGYRLDEDASEVVYIANPSYISPTMNVTAGSITSDIESTINTVTALTYLPNTAAAVSKRDIWSNGTFVALPFTSQTAFVGKFENLGSKICEESWNLTATVVTADGTTTFFSAIDNLSVTVPPNTSFTITFRNSVDPGFTAVMTFEAVTPFLRDWIWHMVETARAVTQQKLDKAMEARLRDSSTDLENHWGSYHVCVPGFEAAARQGKPSSGPRPKPRGRGGRGVFRHVLVLLRQNTRDRASGRPVPATLSGFKLSSLYSFVLEFVRLLLNVPPSVAVASTKKWLLRHAGKSVPSYFKGIGNGTYLGPLPSVWATPGARSLSRRLADAKWRHWGFPACLLPPEGSDVARPGHAASACGPGTAMWKPYHGRCAPSAGQTGHRRGVQERSAGGH
ncbi:hypothetical protein GGX14DRAFT_395285 [Mycena pura]|uniref:Uncharacterized protein n=1 Tax=Mycena pura TaxID=153505 RepID=A0AAD6VGL5_9AGAR|nr:hypothetical protein GGX14DRAFT_395285 [Mycena pura]